MTSSSLSSSSTTTTTTSFLSLLEAADDACWHVGVREKTCEEMHARSASRRCAHARFENRACLLSTACADALAALLACRREHPSSTPAGAAECAAHVAAADDCYRRRFEPALRERRVGFLAEALAANDACRRHRRAEEQCLRANNGDRARCAVESDNRFMCLTQKLSPTLFARYVACRERHHTQQQQQQQQQLALPTTADDVDASSLRHPRAGAGNDDSGIKACTAEYDAVVDDIFTRRLAVLDRTGLSSEAATHDVARGTSVLSQRDADRAFSLLQAVARKLPSEDEW